MELNLANGLHFLTNNESFVAAIIGAIVGGMATYFSEIRFRKSDIKSQEKHYASMIFNDLKSIKSYVDNIKVDDNNVPSVNIRYYEQWQSVVAFCTFLNNDDIALIYEIYDKVYDYNMIYHDKKVKISLYQYEDLRHLINLYHFFNSENTKKLLQKLQLKIK